MQITRAHAAKVKRRYRFEKTLTAGVSPFYVADMSNKLSSWMARFLVSIVEVLIRL